MMMNGAAYRRSRLYNPGEMNSHSCHRITGEATKMPAKNATFMYSMKGSVSRVKTSFSPGGRNFASGRSSQPKIRSAKFQQTRNATPSATNETISRLRSSSRCSRNDIFVSSRSSSSGAAVKSAVVVSAMVNFSGVIGSLHRQCVHWLVS